MKDVDCTIMGPLCIPMKENMKRIEKLFDEVSKCTSFTRRGQETIDQSDHQGINRSGNTLKVTNKDEQVTAYPAMKVTGREKVREQIRTMLHDLSSSENVIGICGIPGSGKTTLAQYVYQSEKGGGHFDLVMWIHVSQNFSVDAIFRRMFEEASVNEEKECPPFNSLNVLLTILADKLTGKRLLLVLDDIWSNGDLPVLVSPFKVGSTGSKILVTSRTESALPILGPDLRHIIFSIPALEDNDFFELFMYYARVNICDGYRGPLHTIGNQIAKKLKGSPLAASVVGGILSKRPDVDFWISVRDREHLNETMGALWWCYQHLDENIRRCFAYCSIFPRGLRLFRDELVNLWVAEGFIRRTNEGEEMEDVGGEYFLELLSTSFLQPGVKYSYRNEDCYLVHDLLHDLAVEVAGSNCFRIENGLRLSGNEGSLSWTGEVCPDIRHLFVMNYNAALVTEKILKLEKLRTLIIYTVPGHASVEYEVIESIFHRLRKLRVLAIAFTHGANQIKKHVSVPESVCQSKHLRYLAFRTIHRGRVTFPSTPIKLYHLCLLDVGLAENVEFSGGDLANLRYLLGSELGSAKLGSIEQLRIPNMGKMNSLQRIAHFCVSKEQGYEIRQLGDLNKLRDSLSVNGLENVTSKVEALEANLAAKERLTELKLEWGRDFETGVEAEVLEGLCPPAGLETLHIVSYHGLGYPNWMLGKQNGSPMYLQKLVFSQCRQQGPPPQLTAFIHLKSLELIGCSWDALPGNMEDLTSLKVLLIERCLRIRSLPTLPQSIEEFTLSLCNVGFMWSCEGKEYFSFKQLKEHLNWQKIQHIPKKTIIYLNYNVYKGYAD
uniref:Uncharacterized protein n=2 Tax=Avena sativa TaxID=4498 RepID=A0ACD6A3D7_AVESA